MRQLEEERKAAEEEKRKQIEQKALEEKERLARLEAERKAKLEEARREAEKKIKEKEERLQAALAAKKAKQEQDRLEAEKKAREREERLRKAEEERLAKIKKDGQAPRAITARKKVIMDIAVSVPIKIKIFLVLFFLSNPRTQLTIKPDLQSSTSENISTNLSTDSTGHFQKHCCTTHASLACTLADAC